MADPSLGKIQLTRSQIENLSEDDLRALFSKLDNHIEASQYAKGDMYLENAHEDQIAFHKAGNRVRVFFGGNRSGKSTAGVNEARWLAAGDHPHRPFRTPSKGCIVLQDFQTHAKDVIIPKIKEWFPPNLIKSQDYNQAKVPVKFHLRNGSVIDIKSHDQDIKVFEGSDYDWVWFDEPPPQLIFKALWRGLTDRRGIAFITGTPITEPWLHDLHMKAESQKNTGTYWTIFSDIEKNAKNLGEGDREEGLKRIEEFLDALDPEERTARKEGKFLHMSGIIFKKWSRATHLIDPFPWPVPWPILVSVDPHPRKPWAVSFIGLTPTGNRILLSSYKIDGVVEDVAKHILWAKNEIQMDNPNSTAKIQSSWIDNYANVESMTTNRGGVRGIKILDELNFHCNGNIPQFQPAPKNVAEKILMFKDWLIPKESKYGDRPTFLVFDNDENNGIVKDAVYSTFVYEIEHYIWAKMRGMRKNQFKNQPEKDNDDILDTVMQICLVLGSKKGQDRESNKPKVHSYLKR